jgi:hypothetical protein
MLGPRCYRQSQSHFGRNPKKPPDLLPRPLHEALSKVWGSALIDTHHLKEGQQPKREEAELLVGLTAMVATYWSKKCDGPMALQRARTVVQKG